MCAKNDMTIKDLYDLDHTLAGSRLAELKYPWEALPLIGKWIMEIGHSLPDSEYEQIGENIWAARSARIAPSASLNGPLIIGSDTEIRHCAFVRGNALIGSGCVVGNSTELKNVILMDKVQVPHYNYVGDSILGFKAHMGAGSITSNVKSDKTLVKVRTTDEPIQTELKKFGAMIGNNVEVGCNSVMNPGTVIGQDSQIYPLSMVRGFVPANSIHKNTGEIIAKV